MKKLLLLSGGVGSRTGLSVPKQYHEIKGTTLVQSLLSEISSFFDEVYVVADPKYNYLFDNFNVKKMIKGSENSRLDSLKNGLRGMPIQDDDLIFIHEAARPKIEIDDLKKHQELTAKKKPSVTTSKVYNTMFVLNEHGEIIDSIPKTNIVNGNNPQSYIGSDLIGILPLLDNYVNDEDLSTIFIGRGIRYNSIEEFGNSMKITTLSDFEIMEKNELGSHRNGQHR